ncbi:hypothetical protein OKW41_004049 [Paraburkholderia sp. UCT70]
MYALVAPGIHHLERHFKEVRPQHLSNKQGFLACFSFA